MEDQLGMTANVDAFRVLSGTRLFDKVGNSALEEIVEDDQIGNDLDGKGLWENNEAEFFDEQHTNLESNLISNGIIEIY